MDVQNLPLIPKVKSAQVMFQSGRPDYITLILENLGYFPEMERETRMIITVTEGCGENYVKSFFDVEPEMVDYSDA